MDAETLEEHLCKGAEGSDEADDFQKIVKVLAPFLRTLKKIKHEKAEVFPTDYEELYLKNTSNLLERLQTGFQDVLSMRTLLQESAELLKVVTKSKSVNLYLTDYDKGEIMLCPKYYQNNPRFQRKYAIGTYLAPHVAFTKEYVISSDILGDVRFPQGIPAVALVKSAICLPILTNVEGNCIGVIELYRECSDRPYDLTNLQICNALTAWMGIAIEQNKARMNLMKEIEVQKQLCSLADLYFSGVIPFNKIISDFLKVTKTSVNADKGALYIFREPVTPNATETLWAEAYEEGCDERGNVFLYKKRDRVKFTLDKPGIPGYAGRTGRVLNVQDAYKDYRFDKKSDSVLYRTRSVLAVPVKNEVGVLGVIVLINSLTSPYFRSEDVALIQSFASYLTLICDYYFLENFFNKTQMRLIMTDRILDFLTKPALEDLNNFKMFLQSELAFPTGFLRFEWELPNYDEDCLRLVGSVFMHSEILDPCFELHNFADFLMRIRKCYRPLPYHNFEHAINVVHFVFNILLRNKDSYNTVEVITLLLAALCHDIDHSGFTNSFLTLKNDIAYKLYGEICGEAHRFEFVLFLLQQTDLLSNFSQNNVHLIHRNLKRLLLALDLAIHFQNRERIIELLNAESFNWEDPEHRYLSQNIILHCSDHAAYFKSFEYVRKYISLFYRELHKQGDFERSMGFTPLPSLDRNKNDLIPENQTIFLTIVLLPCVEVLERLFPNLSLLLDLIKDTLDKWTELANLRGRDIWKMKQALMSKGTKRNHRVTLVSTLSSLRTIASDTRSIKY